jgi:peptidoglycan hydrolase-like protein with peptidoglycan-binding domain
MNKSKAIGINIREVLGVVLLVVASFLFISFASAAQPAFVKDLKVGIEGDDVAALQTFLEARGYLVMPPGVAKGYFGQKTASALVEYQKAVGIFPPAGYFGPITRARVMAEWANGAPSTTPQTPTNTGVPVVTGINTISNDTVVVTGTGFSTSLMFGKLNTVVVGNSSKSKVLVLTQVVSKNGTTLEIQLPGGWINTGETLSVSVRNDLSGQTGDTFVSTTTAKFIDMYPGQGSRSTGGGSVTTPTQSPSTTPTPTPTGSGQSFNGGQSNLASIWSALQSFYSK